MVFVFADVVRLQEKKVDSLTDGKEKEKRIEGLEEDIRELKDEMERLACKQTSQSEDFAADF